MEADDSLPDDYVGKHSEEKLLLLNVIVSVPSSSEPSTPVHETQQEQSEFSPPSEQKGTFTSLVKGPSSRVKLNHPATNILGSLNDNIRLRSSSEPSTPVHETQQEQCELSPPPEQKGTSTSLVKGPSSKVKLNYPATNIWGSLNDNLRF